MKLLESDFNQRLIITSPQKEHSMNIFQKGMSLISKGEIKFTNPIKEMKVLYSNYIMIGFEKQSLILKFNQDTASFQLIMNINEGIVDSFELNESNSNDKLIWIVSSKTISIIDLIKTEIIIKQEIEQEEKQEENVANKNKRIILTTNNNIQKNIIITADSQNYISIYKYEQNQINKIYQHKSQYCCSAITSSNNWIAYSSWFQPNITMIHIKDNNNKIESSENNNENAIKTEEEQQSSNYEIYTIDISPQKVVRSLIFHENNKLFIGYSDDINSNTIVTSNTKNMVIGYKPVKFRSLQLFSSYCSSSTPLSISCISNEVSILSLRKLDDSYQRYQKTYFNVQDVNQIDEMEINNVPYMLMARKNSLQIGGLEMSQKFHIYNFGKDVKEQNEFRCQTELIEVIKNMSVSVSIIENEEEDVIASNILLHSIKNQDLLDQIKLNGLCVYSINSVNDYLFVGGRSTLNDYQGFLYTYLIDNDNKITLIDKIEFKIPVMHISKYSENSIAIILGHDSFKVYKISYPNSQDFSIFKPNQSTKFLVEILSQSNLSLTAMSMDCNNKNQIVVADRMRGIQLFQEINKKAMIAAKSPFPVFSTNAKFLGEDNIVFSDQNSNILILRQNELCENDLEKIKLLVLSSINNGDIIQTSLKRQVSTKDVKDKYISTDGFDQVIYGTKKGWIGVIMTLNEQAYTILQDLQESILSTNKCSLNFDYNKWKSIKNIPCGKGEKSNFIDGDIIFKILKMNQKQLVKVLDGMSAIPKPSIADIEQLIENLDLLIF